MVLRCSIQVPRSARGSFYGLCLSIYCFQTKPVRPVNDYKKKENKNKKKTCLPALIEIDRKKTQTVFEETTRYVGESCFGVKNLVSLERYLILSGETKSRIFKIACIYSLHSFCASTILYFRYGKSFEVPVPHAMLLFVTNNNNMCFQHVRFYF